MFNNLEEFEYKRGPEEALGFYLVYAGGLLLITFILGPMLQMSGMLGPTKADMLRNLSVFGMLTGIMYCAGMGAVIVQRKKMEGWFGWALVFLAGLAAIVHGIVGMVVVAYMTTRPLYWPTPEAEVQRREAAAAAQIDAAKKARAAARAAAKFDPEAPAVAELTKAAKPAKAVKSAAAPPPATPRRNRPERRRPDILEEETEEKGMQPPPKKPDQPA